MVKLNKIYTKKGDDGTTGLGDGTRCPKTAARVEAYGEVDEANAVLGRCVLEIERDSGGLSDPSFAPKLVALLQRVQNDMFDVGADLCVPLTPDASGPELRVTPGQVDALEKAIDEWNERLAPLDSFVLPGGSPAAVALHEGRTVVRRAERRVVGLLGAEAAATSPETVRYLNRLSDLLFVLARVANRDGAADVKWAPGAGRDEG